ncbi:DUF2207 domain-containing protein [Microbacterium gubbeenense]|uniref:DUF2207 domain-containing protein n=2 Tax=Microbacterium gubbeenense TaxID=159896 RepID=UPI00040F8213|nr:DUF2207 domain-containing protein [Microbacterium gubbeenense]
MAILGSAAPASAAPASAAAPVTAGVDDFTFSSLDTVFELSRDEEGAGIVTVTETFVAEFPDFDQNRGMRRAIPTTSFDQPLAPELVSVTDENGDPRPADTDTEDGYFTITSAGDDYVRGEQTYVITYTLENVASTMENGLDEFYWDVNGEDWRQPFDRISASVHVDPSLESALTGDSACYVGWSGSDHQCSVAQSTDEEGRQVFSTETYGIEPYEVMTLAVGFEADTFTEFDASPFASGWAIGQLIAAVAGVGGIVWAAISRRRYLQDSPGRPVVIPEFEPPAGWDALRSALLLHATDKAIAAEILEQAVGGSLRIVEREKIGVFGTKKRMIAELVDPSRADKNGLAVLAGLFPELRPGEEFEFGRTSDRFAKSAQKVVQTGQTNVRKFNRKVPGKAYAGPLLLTFAAVAINVVCGVVALVGYVQPTLPIVLLVAGGVEIITVSIMLSRKPLTPEGAVARDHLRGLEMFMSWAEADRIRMLQSPAGAERRPIDVDDDAQMLDLYEKLLPFAVIFRIEMTWAELLATRYHDDSPYWYAGSGSFSASSFSSSMYSLTTSTSSSSSSSGGSTGGGSAGGGGGGGGGGGV